jgi:hypothetical protein
MGVYDMVSVGVTLWESSEEASGYVWVDNGSRE